MLGDMSAETEPYGTGDASFRAVGGEPGIRELVVAFYRFMDALPEARTIRAMHPDDLEISVDKLARFLCGWLGGPKRYQEKYGSISIPGVHRHLPVTARERDAWLVCMQRAIEERPYPADFKRYLLEQLAVPAERIRQVCVQEHGL
jgi:hemoglobin